jgi:tetratricopeptide (TPR) repeat protein
MKPGSIEITKLLSNILVVFLCCFMPVKSIGADQPAAASTLSSLIDNGHFKRARTLIEAQYRIKPQDLETLWLMSRLKQAYHDFNASLEFAEKALAADPKNSRYHLRVADSAGELTEHVNFLRKMSLGRRFKKEIDTTLVLDPNNVDALLMLMEYYLQAPSILGGDKGKARTIPDRIMSIDPVQGYLAKMRIAIFDKHWDQIEGFCLKAVEARPGSYEAHTELANHYNIVRKFGEAEKNAREAVRIDASRVDAHIKLVMALAEQKKWPELDIALKEAEKAIPDNLEPYFIAGSLCFQSKNDNKSYENYIRKYLTQEPEPDMASPSSAHRLLGHILCATDRKAEGIAELNLAVKLDPNSPAKDELKKMK